MNTIPLTDTQEEATMFGLTHPLSFKDIGRRVFETLGLGTPQIDTLDASASDSDSSSTAAFLEAREQTIRAIQETETGIEGRLQFDSIEAFEEWQASL